MIFVVLKSSFFVSDFLIVCHGLNNDIGGMRRVIPALASFESDSSRMGDAFYQTSAVALSCNANCIVMFGMSEMLKGF